MARLAMIERDALPAEQRRFHDAVRAIRRRPISGPFIVTMNSSPDLASRFAQLGHYFHARGQADESIVPIRVRALVSLIGARALDAPYEWAAWVNWALQAGITQETVDAIRQWKTPPHPSAEEILVTDICTQMISGEHRVNDATYQAALEHFGSQALVEVVATLGYFAMIALPLNAFEIEMSGDQMGQRKAFAPLQVGATTWPGGATSARSLPRFSGRSEPRLPRLGSHADIAPEHQHFLDRVVRTRGWLSPAFQLLLHSPDLAERIACVGEFFLYQTILPPAPKALAWLVTARELDCGYTWSAGAGAARAAGLDPVLVEALEQGGSLHALDAQQRCVVELCHQLLRGNHHLSDATFDAGLTHFGTAALVQLSTAVGYVAMLSLLANAFELAPASDDARPAL